MILSSASSAVTMPCMPAVVVHHRDGQQVVLGDDLGDLILARGRVHGDEPVVHEVLDGRLRLGQDQVLQREHADQSPFGRR